MCKSLRRVAGVGFVTLLLYGASPASAQTAPTLGTAGQFGALANSGVTGSAGGGTTVNGDVGSSPTATIINFPPSSTVLPFIVHGTNDGVVQQARLDAIAAYNNLAGQSPDTEIAAQLDGATLTSGIYSFTGGAADLATNGTLTLNGGGVFVFQVSSSLTANVGSSVTGTADPCNVFWQIGTDATLNGSTFWGTVIADASITVGAGANVVGRVLAGTGATGAVTMSGAGGNTIGGCSTQPTTTTTTSAPATTTTTPATTTTTPETTTTTPETTTTAPETTTTAPGTTTTAPGTTTTAPGTTTTAPGTTTTAPGTTTTAPGTTTTAPGTTTTAPGTTTTAPGTTTTAPGTTTAPSTTTTTTPGEPVPTLPEWAMIALIVLLAMVGFTAMRRRST